MKVRMVGIDDIDPEAIEEYLGRDKEIQNNITNAEDQAGEDAVGDIILKLLDVRRMLPRSMFLNKMVQRPVFADFDTLLDEVIEDFRQSFRKQQTH